MAGGLLSRKGAAGTAEGISAGGLINIGGIADG